MGSLAAVIAGVVLHLPPVIHGIVALLVGIVFGALWGGLVGLFKAKRGVNRSYLVHYVELGGLLLEQLHAHQGLFEKARQQLFI